MTLYGIVKNLISIILISLLLLYPSFAKEENIVLEANGQGITESQAISNALDILSQQIFVSVKSQITSNEKLINDSFSNEIENNSTLSSNGYFQNISVYNKKKYKKNGFEVTVGLTKESISSTIDYLFLQLKEDQIYNLPKSKLREQLDISNFLFSLISYAKINNITFKNQKNNLANYIVKLNKVLSSDSVIKFILSPDNKDALITIEKTTYKPYENIYLGKGKYFYEIKAKGYKNEQGSIDLDKGDNTEIEVYLQKKLKESIPVKIKITNKTSIPNDILLANSSSLISKNQMKESSNSNNYIEFQFLEKVSPSVISGYNNNVVNVIIISNINGIEKGETFSISNLSKDSKQEPFQNNVINQINAKSQMFFARLFD